MAPIHELLAEKADEIEAELRRLGWWNTPKPDMNFKQAFGMDTMAFAQWLTYVLVPRIREIVATEADPPRSSSVGVQAVRELDGDPEAEDLKGLLSELDGIIESA